MFFQITISFIVLKYYFALFYNGKKFFIPPVLIFISKTVKFNFLAWVQSNPPLKGDRLIIK